MFIQLKNTFTDIFLLFKTFNIQKIKVSSNLSITPFITIIYLLSFNEILSLKCHLSMFKNKIQTYFLILRKLFLFKQLKVIYK